MSSREMVGVLCVPVREAVAQSFVNFCECCDEEDRPLTGLQKTTILACMFGSMDGLQAELEGNVRVSELLREIAEELPEF